MMRLWVGNTSQIKLKTADWSEGRALLFPHTVLLPMRDFRQWAPGAAGFFVRVAKRDCAQDNNIVRHSKQSLDGSFKGSVDDAHPARSET